MIKLFTGGIKAGLPQVEAAAAGMAQATRSGISSTDYTAQLGTINRSIQGISTGGGGDVAVYVQISDGQLERALTKITRGQSLRSGGR
jgi:hypothetical protein